MASDSRKRLIRPSTRRLPRRRSYVAGVASVVAALVFAGVARAEECYAEFGYIDGQDYLNEHHPMWDASPYLTFTDQSDWFRNAGGGQGYSAERRDYNSIIQYFANVDGGGEHTWDNGSYSPFRKTWLFGWYGSGIASWLWQINENGSC